MKSREEFDGMQILIPIASRSIFFPQAEYFFPKPLIDVAGRPMIERVVESLKVMYRDPEFMFVVEKQDCQKSMTIGLSISIRIIFTIEKDRPKVKPR